MDNILEEILSSDDDVILDVKEKKISTVRNDLEEGEIEEWYSVCTGFYFDPSIMLKVPGCVVCNSGKICSRPRRI
tara:strand:- start:220 stop:444 length:225 start_codon:yes stop_codon:yes gene_type:complete